MTALAKDKVSQIFCILSGTYLIFMFCKSFKIRSPFETPSKKFELLQLSFEVDLWKPQSFNQLSNVYTNYAAQFLLTQTFKSAVALNIFVQKNQDGEGSQNWSQEGFLFRNLIRSWLYK